MSKEKPNASSADEDFNDFLVTSSLAIANAISQSTMVEGMINGYIAEYYTHCPNGNYQQAYLAFMADVLDNRFITFNAKIDILFKIFKRLGKEQKGHRKIFEDWQRIRNICAHGRVIGGKNQLLYGGEFYDVKKLHDDFSQYQLKVMAILSAHPELRGPYFNLIPTKK